LRKLVISFLILIILLSSAAQALKTFSGSVVTIDTPVNDDVFAAANAVNINAPVNSAVVAGGNLNVNAPVAGDLVALGGQVLMGSDVGGKVVAAGGNLKLNGNVSTNAVMAGGQVNILPGSTIGRDALIAGGEVVNAGRINGNLTVEANTFQNTGSAGRVSFKKVDSNQTRRAENRLDIFGILMALGYLIIGLALLRYLPGLFFAIDCEVRKSPALKAVVGFVLIIASSIAILILAITVVGIPIALIASMLLIVTLALTGTFVAFSLGRWIGSLLKLNMGDMALFVIGFVVLNVLFLLPYIGGLVGLISLSLGFGAIIYALRRHWHKLSNTVAACPA
jgi:hypothetical protein